MFRATDSKAKQEKKQLIIDEAFSLYEETNFKTFKMDVLAKRCNVSKGLLFKYFSTKEQLFFEMLDLEYIKMFKEIENVFINYEIITPVILKESLIKITRTLFATCNPLSRLTRIKNIILEQNIDYEFAKNHKLNLTEISKNVLENISRRLDGITKEEFLNIFEIHGALLYGNLISCSTSNVIKQVIKDYNLVEYDVDPIEKTIKQLSLFIDNYLK